MKQFACVVLSLLVLSSSRGWADDDHETKEIKKEIAIKVIVEDGEVKIDGLGGDTKVLKLSDLKDGTWVSESPEGLNVDVKALFIADGDVDAEVLSKLHNAMKWKFEDGKHFEFRIAHGDHAHGDHEHGDHAHGGEKIIEFDGGKIVIKGHGDFTLDKDANVWFSKLSELGEHDANVWVSKMGSAGDYMIGLLCTPVSDTLRSQLKLGDGGLVVMDVVDDSPADEAGIKEHDVIVSVGDEELEDLGSLIKAVQTAGENDDSLTVKLIREGDWQEISVTPAKRNSDKKVRVKKTRMGGGENAKVKEFKDKRGNKVVIMKELGGEGGDVTAKVEAIIEGVWDGEDIDLDAIKELAKEHGGKVMIRKEKKSSGDTDAQDLRDEIEELKKTVAELKEALDDE